jgi:hypothetical protein
MPRSSTRFDSCTDRELPAISWQRLILGFVVFLAGVGVWVDGSHVLGMTVTSFGCVLVVDRFALGSRLSQAAFGFTTLIAGQLYVSHGWLLVGVTAHIVGILVLARYMQRIKLAYEGEARWTSPRQGRL